MLFLLVLGECGSIDGSEDDDDTEKQEEQKIAEDKDVKEDFLLNDVPLDGNDLAQKSRQG